MEGFFDLAVLREFIITIINKLKELFQKWVDDQYNPETTAAAE